MAWSSAGLARGAAGARERPLQSRPLCSSDLKRSSEWQRCINLWVLRFLIPHLQAHCRTNARAPHLPERASPCSGSDSGTAAPLQVTGVPNQSKNHLNFSLLASSSSFMLMLLISLVCCCMIKVPLHLPPGAQRMHLLSQAPSSYLKLTPTLRPGTPGTGAWILHTPHRENGT